MCQGGQSSEDTRRGHSQFLDTHRAAGGMQLSDEAIETNYQAALKDGSAAGKTKEQWYAEWKAGADQTIEDKGKKLLGADYKDPEGKYSNRPPNLDNTDKVLAQARTSAYQRLQLGKNRQSSFATQGKLGGFDVAKPVLGGY